MYITNEKITDFINIYYKPLDEDMDNLRNRCEADGIPLILRETEIFFDTFLNLIQPEKILEIGTAYGYSSSYFAKKIEGAVIHTIEKEPELVEFAKGNFEDLGIANRIRVFQGDASDVLDALRYPGCDSSDESLYDFVFIDAGKSKYREFFDKSIKLCSHGAVIVCDNVLLKASVADNKFDANRRHRTNIKRMKEFLEYVNSRNDMTTSLISCGDGLLITILD